MARKRRPFTRETAVRDARLIVIATEDSKASVTYFNALQSHYQNPRVHVQILLRKEDASAPEYILAQLVQWREEYQIAENDELWLVIDVDRWGDRKLSRIAQECLQKENHLAVSNPAIELWFLLHLVDIQDYSLVVQNEFLENEKVTANRTRLDQALLDIVGSYNKSNLDVTRFIPHVQVAIERAKQLDIYPADRWPQQLGTHVYRLIESIIS